MLKQAFLIVLLGAGINIFFGEQAKDLITLFINKFVKPQELKDKDGLRLFTLDELKVYNGEDKPELYLSIFGNVFDVTKGAKHYAPGKQYHVFVGTDASRNFVTGKFNKEDATDDIADLDAEKLLSLKQWMTFYKRDYPQVGKIVGRFYDETGEATPYSLQIEKLIKDAETFKGRAEEEKKKFPPCNMEWDQDRGSRVWCTNESGGLKRKWAGVPRRLFEPGTKHYRCACVKDPDNLPENMEEYVNCNKKADSCYVKGL